MEKKARETRQERGLASRHCMDAEWSRLLFKTLGGGRPPTQSFWDPGGGSLRDPTQNPFPTPPKKFPAAPGRWGGGDPACLGGGSEIKEKPGMETFGVFCPANGVRNDENCHWIRKSHCLRLVSKTFWHVNPNSSTRGLVKKVA